MLFSKCSPSCARRRRADGVHAGRRGRSGAWGCAGLEYPVGSRGRDIGKIGPRSTFLNNDRDRLSRRRSRQHGAGQMDDCAKQAVLTNRRSRPLGISDGAVARNGKASDRSRRCRPTQVLAAMNVIEDDKQLEGERKQRTPRSKFQVRANPAHPASITSRTGRDLEQGAADVPAVAKEVGAPVPISKLLSRIAPIYSLPAEKFVNAARQPDR
jgi:hypothetical protein